jgi:MIP family channel proteins
MNLRGKYIAEFIGTFTLVFIGCGACIAAHQFPEEIRHVGVALAFGFVVMGMIYAFGHVSGAHINPAVTVALVVAKRFPWTMVGPYLAVQMAGALLASFCHLLIFGEVARKAAFGATVPLGGNVLQGLALETILTFFLMTVIMGVATDKRAAPGIAGIAIGFTVSFDCLAAGKCCGASMNPARSFGPAILAGGPALQHLWIYFVAPLVGSAIAALVYERLRGGEEFALSVPRDLNMGRPGKQARPPR